MQQSTYNPLFIGYTKNCVWYLSEGKKKKELIVKLITIEPYLSFGEKNKVQNKHTTILAKTFSSFHCYQHQEPYVQAFLRMLSIKFTLDASRSQIYIYYQALQTDLDQALNIPQ